jgi:acetate kinase
VYKLDTERVMMNDYVLILNAGSSSLKFCVFRPPIKGNLEMVVRGQIEGIGGAATLSVKDANGKVLVSKRPCNEIRDALGALDVLAEWLRAQFTNARIVGVGHRVVHGGTRYFLPTIITTEVINDLQQLVPLAPLHQPYNLAAIEAVTNRLPEVPQVACFDTGFHQGHDRVTDLVPLPEDLRKHGIQRYGFHGLSYEYISSVLPQVAPEISGGRVIVAHLGSGASLCAFRGGKSVDSTLGFTALDGLCMGTRPGALDPGIVLYLFQTLGLSASEVETILYKKSGLLAISGISNDMRILIEDGGDRASLALEYFTYRAAKEIGALTAVLKGIDALVFTAGIGENSPLIRERICEASSWLGIDIDRDANNSNNIRISTPDSKVAAFVIPTNEELMIARHLSKTLKL